MRLLLHTNAHPSLVHRNDGPLNKKIFIKTNHNNESSLKSPQPADFYHFYP